AYKPTVFPRLSSNTSPSRGVARPADGGQEHRAIGMTTAVSPAYSMHEADDQYMGYASKDELITFLSELLEAERAGARVTLESAHAAESGPVAELMRNVQHDEARWCGMLSRQLKDLGAAPSRKVGAFYGKAMAIADLAER